MEGKTELKKLVFIVFLFFTYNYCRSTIIDSTYIEKSDKKFIIRGLAAYRSINFTLKLKLKNDSTSSKDISYKPNVDRYCGLGFSYNNFGINIYVKIPNSDKNNTIYGNTDYTDFKIIMYRRRFGGNFSYRNYSGFYIDNPGGIFKNWIPGSPKPQRQDAKYESIGIESYYVFNYSKYSILSAYKQTENQKKSSSSILLLADITFTDISGDSSLIPSIQESYYEDIKGFTGGKFRMYSLIAGYSYYWVISKRFYITPFVFAGPGIQNIKYDIEKGSFSNYSLFFKSNFRLASGYNGKRFITGINLTGDFDIVPLKDVRLRSFDLFISSFVGVKF